MLHFLGRHPFLLLGLVTLALFFGVEALDRGGWTAAAAWLARPLRILIMPMYMVWLLFMMVNAALLGPAPSQHGLAWLATIIWLAGMAAGLMPYALVDYLITRWGRRRSSGSAA
jgi:hypothetical protein